jgi:hypothetical protein
MRVFRLLKRISFIVTLIIIIHFFITRYSIDTSKYVPSQNHNSTTRSSDLAPDVPLKRVIQENDVKIPKTLGETVPSFRDIHSGDRDRVIEVRHVCISPDNSEPFYYGPDLNLPSINIAASAQELDRFFTLRNDNSQGPNEEIDFVNRDLFFQAGVWSYHMSHFIQNNAMPLINLMYQYYSQQNPDFNWMTDLANKKNGEYGRDLWMQDSVFDQSFLPIDRKFGVSDKHGIKKTTCFNRAIIGLNSSCSCCGCKNDYSDQVVHEIFREVVFKTHLTEKEYAIAQERIHTSYRKRPFYLVVVNRKGSRSFSNIKEVKEYLEKNKVTHQIAYMEDMSIKDQVKLFALNATTLMAVHGNAIGNGFWMPPGSNVWEFHSYDGGSAMFEHLFNDAKQEYYDGSFLPTKESPNGLFLDYKVIKCREDSCKTDGQTGFNANVVAQMDKLQMLLDNYNPQYD